MKKYETSSSVVPLIEVDYGKFTVVEKTIADFFIANREQMDFSSKHMAQLLHVSEASLSRFAKKMGYSGYREFIYQYQPSVSVQTPQVAEQSLDVLNAYQELLRKTYNLIKEEQLHHVAQLLTEKSRIFLYGFGSSGLAAQEMKLRLLRLGLDAEAVTEFHQLVMNEARITSECLVLGISLSGATKEVEDAMHSAAERGAATVFITSCNEQKWQEDFDEVILTAVKKNLEYGNVISPQFPILILLDLIYAEVLRLCEDKAGEGCEKLLWEKIKKYHL